jgi:hypothetical protein
MSEDALVRLENLRRMKHDATYLSEKVGGRYTYWRDLLLGNKSFGEKAARKIEAALGLVRGQLDIADFSQINRPIYPIDRAQSAINNVATLGQILEGLAEHLKAMDADTRRKAMLLISDLATDPDSHSEITAMIELSIRSRRKKAA